MFELLQDPGFEEGSAAWIYSEDAIRLETAAIDGQYGAWLRASTKLVVGFPPTFRIVEGTVSQPAPTAQVGSILEASADVMLSASIEGGAAIELCVQAQPGVTEVLYRLEPWQIGSGIRRNLAGLFEVTDPSPVIIVRTVLGPNTGALGVWFVDNVSLANPSAGEDLMSGHLETLIANVKAVIEGIDPNIGHVITTVRRWETQKELFDAAGLTLSTPSELDAPELSARRAVRLWMLDGRATTERMTNKTEQFAYELSLRAFYQHEIGSDHGVALRKASALILEKLLTEEHGAVAGNMGEGFMGFLGESPLMTTQVQTGLIGGAGYEIQGYIAELRLTAFEEIRH